MDYKFYYSNNNGKDDYGLKYVDECGNGGNNNNINKSMHGFENINNNKVPDWSLKSTNNKNISGKDFSFEKLNEVDKEKIKVWNKSEQINVNKVVKQINNVDTNKEEESKKENDSDSNDNNDNVIKEENEPEEIKLNENEHVEEQHLENKEQSQEENEKEIITENSDKNEESKDKEQQEVQINNDEK